jgi:hypothetical protein
MSSSARPASPVTTTPWIEAFYPIYATAQNTFSVNWRVRQTLRMPSGRISDELIDELLAGASTEEEIAGPGGLLADLTKRLVERAMEVELTEHVGYEPHCEPPGGAGNQRNGTTPWSGAAEQVCDYLGRPLVATRGELLQPLGVLILHSDDDRQLGVGIADVSLDVAWIDRRQVRVEIAGLGIRVCPRVVRHAQLLSSLRSRGEESQPVTISQVVGSTVSSMTTVRERPPSVRPMSRRRFPVDVLCGLRTMT